MGHSFATSGCKNGPFCAGRHGPGVARVSECLHLQCFASELVLAIFRGLSSRIREVVLHQCQNRCFGKPFTFEMPKRFLAICRSKESVFFSALPTTSTWGHENCLFPEVLQSHRTATSIFGAATGFRLFGNMPPDLGVKHVSCLVLARGVSLWDYMYAQEC